MSWTVWRQPLNAMLGRLDDAFRQIRQFSADASHELQTPVTILKGELEVALRASGVRRTISVTCVVPLEEERIARLVDGLLLLARADAGALRMDHTPVDLAQLVEEACEQTRVLADVKHVTLDLGPVDHDRAGIPSLRQLLLNLVDNGLKHTAAAAATLALATLWPRSSAPRL